MSKINWDSYYNCNRKDPEDEQLEDFLWKNPHAKLEQIKQHKPKGLDCTLGEEFHDKVILQTQHKIEAQREFERKELEVYKKSKK